MKSRNIGIKVNAPGQRGEDKHDPFYSSLGVRGRLFTGRVISMNSAKTAKVEFERRFPIKKYERYEKRRTLLLVHKPDSLAIEVGDIVRFAECRPISKTKNFVIIERLGK